MPIGSLADQGPIFLGPGGLFSYYKNNNQKSTAFFTSKNSKLDHQEILGLLSRNAFRSSETQEPRKGAFSKGVSAESSVAPKETKNQPRSAFGTQRTTAKRGVHFIKTRF